MVWESISLEGRTDLHFIANGALTAVRYQDEILRGIVKLDAGAVGPGFFLVQDNARPNVDQVCRQFLDDEGIDATDWPSCSPGLNPIENVSDIMYHCCRRQSSVRECPRAHWCPDPGLGGTYPDNVGSACRHMVAIHTTEPPYELLEWKSTQIWSAFDYKFSIAALWI